MAAPGAGAVLAGDIMRGGIRGGRLRAFTPKRVAFAVGDGALAVSCVHDFLGTYD